MIFAIMVKEYELRFSSKGVHFGVNGVIIRNLSPLKKICILIPCFAVIVCDA